jgi:hypothetical protein
MTSDGNRSGEWDPQKAAYLHGRSKHDWQKRGYELALMVEVGKPNPAMCCEACVFGRGDHAKFCSVNLKSEQAGRAGGHSAEQRAPVLEVA